VLTSLRHYPKTLIAWGFISLAIMLLLSILPRPYALDASALLLTVIAAIYVGFALQDGRQQVMIQEITAASMFIVLAALGLWLSPYLWVVGLVLHSAWDWQHHSHRIQTQVPDYYPPVCIVVDVALAAFLLFWI
jgi:hypothetical protein